MGQDSSTKSSKIIITTVIPAHIVMPIREYMVKYALKQHVSVYEVTKTITCESQWENVQSRLYNKRFHRRELSYGIAQINLPTNPSISKSQALNEKFAVRYMVDQIAKGKGRLWSCYRILGFDKKKPPSK